ncbi:PREDICTED: nucleoside diphosphate-linked moiety X motif 19, mitochondrial [Acanthisitta chloris]|uniref:nucleoside diphosphate-linked moiety X motif 19, mitochondrial n=1 Tax=Acanthisitta chloris TaxID=57068 RepID=UPI0004F0C644|nr:PREDICTED: nucleoside diphosphate-linked moiety X motif 19, mitochondrial [Acanthisitta chloris]
MRGCWARSICGDSETRIPVFFHRFYSASFTLFFRTHRVNRLLAGDGWSSPPEALERLKSQEIWFPPPQFYEFCRLCNFSSLHELHKFSWDRALEGCERWMPVMLTASDGFIQLLPGDELYPEDPDYTGEKKVVMSTDKKVEDLMKEGSVFHRIVIKSTNNLAVYVNIEAKYKHVNPVMRNSDGSDYNSRL